MPTEYPPIIALFLIIGWTMAKVLPLWEMGEKLVELACYIGAWMYDWRGHLLAALWWPAISAGLKKRALRRAGCHLDNRITVREKHGNREYCRD